MLDGDWVAFDVDACVCFWDMYALTYGSSGNVFYEVFAAVSTYLSQDHGVHGLHSLVHVSVCVKVTSLHHLLRALHGADRR